MSCNGDLKGQMMMIKAVYGPNVAGSLSFFLLPLEEMNILWEFDFRQKKTKNEEIRYVSLFLFGFLSSSSTHVLWMKDGFDDLELC